MSIIDLHCDTLLKLILSKEETSLFQNAFCVDIEKLKNAGSRAQFFAAFINIKYVDDPLEACLKMIDRFYIEINKNSNSIAFAGGYDNLYENLGNQKISAFLTVEEGAVLKGELDNLKSLYKLGVRLMTLTWNYTNEIGYPNYNFKYADKGLTNFGKEVVCEMNQLGMAIDVSHLSDEGFYDVAKLSRKPFIASHSNSRSVKNHCRNLTDDMIKILAEHGGIMGMNYESSFVGDSELSTLTDLIKHIKHIKDVGGIDVLALGSDFDGISPYTEVKNIGETGKLIAALDNNGFTENEIEHICYKNAERFIRDVM